VADITWISLQIGDQVGNFLVGNALDLVDFSFHTKLLRYVEVTNRIAKILCRGSLRADPHARRDVDPSVLQPGRESGHVGGAIPRKPSLDTISQGRDIGPILHAGNVLPCDLAGSIPALKLVLRGNGGAQGTVFIDGEVEAEVADDQGPGESLIQGHRPRCGPPEFDGAAEVGVDGFQRLLEGIGRLIGVGRESSQGGIGVLVICVGGVQTGVAAGRWRGGRRCARGLERRVEQLNVACRADLGIGRPLPRVDESHGDRADDVDSADDAEVYGALVVIKQEELAGILEYAGPRVAFIDPAANLLQRFLVVASRRLLFDARNELIVGHAVGVGVGEGH